MQCKKAQSLLSGYLDNELSPIEQKFIKGHLAHCPACFKKEEELRAQQDILRNAKRRQVPEQVWQNIRETIVREQLDEQAKEKNGILDWLRGLVLAPRPRFALASAVAMVILVMVLVGISTYKRQALNR
ncbi:MAG: zf-HC2 domain-containing protein, partial [Candidatus Omnitrophica bacterium]|nr:zf-HC2 domain-containing protein [Candidatus Omnitrophota bacterium]